MKTIRGITWDHPRGFDSIVAATEQFHKASDSCTIQWDKRTLLEFGDLPLSQLIDQYDLLIIDHPFVGEAHFHELLVPLDDILPLEFLQLQSQLHVGQCYASYTYAGNQYALPVDAAAQFCAFNQLDLSPSDLPKNWDEYLDCISDKSFCNRVLWPLCPTDLWCSFLTLAAQLGAKANSTVFDEDGLNLELSLETLEWFNKLTKNIPLQCLSMNPIETLSALGSKGEYWFSPLLFGYNNYCRKNNGRLRFTNALHQKDQNPISVLGGAGIAVSSRSKNTREIAEFLRFIIQDKVLSGPYFEAGGQPSLASSWSSESLNTLTTDFFNATIETIKNAYVRPRVSGFNSFQIKAAEILHNRIRESSAASIVNALNDLFHAHCSVKGDDKPTA